jgi:hypothetical protein
LKIVNKLRILRVVKIFSKTFIMKSSGNYIFNPAEKEYVIQLKKGIFRWWWLLILLPLLLLIKCDRNIKFKVLDGTMKSALPGTKVSVQYSQNEVNQKIRLNNQSDMDGIVVFKIDKRPIYKLIYADADDFIVNYEANHPDYKTFISSDKISSLSTGVQQINLYKGGEKVKVITIDSITRKPLQAVEVEAIAESKSHKATTDSLGIAEVADVPLRVGKEIAFYARKENYEVTRKTILFNEQIMGKDIIIPMLSIDKGGMRGERGELNVNLKWATKDDLDLIMIAPCNDTVYFQKKKISCDSLSGVLDVDANIGPQNLLSDPQENIYWTKAPKGQYQVIVLCYKKRTFGKIPFTVTLINKNNKKESKGDLSNQKEYKIVETLNFE